MNDKQILLEFQRRYHETLAENESLRQKLAIAEEALRLIIQQYPNNYRIRITEICDEALAKIGGEGC